MITAIAIDDEPEAIDVIQMHASKLNDLDVIGYFHKPNEAMMYLRNNPVDLIFLDINMPEISGIEMLRQLKSLPFIIFTTAYEQYAVESYKFEAVDYLLKPIDFDSFLNAINKVRKITSVKFKANLTDNYIFIKDGTKTVKLFFNDILIMKGCGNYVEFITSTDKFVSRTTLSQLINKLPNNKFVRVHNSYIINIEQIDKIEYNQINIKNHKISIGEGYRNAFFEKINDKMI